MTALFAILGTAGLASVALVLTIMARLTQRWELVTRVKSYYEWFYISGGLILLAAFVRLIRAVQLASQSETGSPGRPWSWLYVLFYHVPLIAGATISVVVAGRNWGWLLKEQNS
jgi:hypothetical protein